MDKQKKKYDLDVIRALSCISILIYHLSGYWSDYDWHGIWSWSNIGVQVFFFLSGYLAAFGKKIYDGKWVFRKLKKLLVPYWIYLIVIIPVIYWLDSTQITPSKAALAYSGLMGLFWDYRIKPIGVLWFVSYILVCYALTPFINWYYEKVDKKAKSVKSIGGGNMVLCTCRPVYSICASGCDRTACDCVSD